MDFFERCFVALTVVGFFGVIAIVVDALSHAGPAGAQDFSLDACELRHPTQPRIGLFCRCFSLRKTWTRRQLWVLFESGPPSSLSDLTHYRDIG
jgi:hypothetical protein